MNWKDIKGYEGIYQISDCGVVRSLDRSVETIKGTSFKMKGKELKTYLNNGGYECIDLTVNKERRKFTVHRLVALHFCEGFEEGLDVNHIDGVRTNNHSSNLEWVTRKENIQDTIERGTFKNHQSLAAESRKKPIKVFDKKGNLVGEYPSVREAATLLGLEENHLGATCRGTRPWHKGYRGKYV